MGERLEEYIEPRGGKIGKIHACDVEKMRNFWAMKSKYIIYLLYILYIIY